MKNLQFYEPDFFFFFRLICFGCQIKLNLIFCLIPSLSTFVLWKMKKGEEYSSETSPVGFQSRPISVLTLKFTLYKITFFLVVFAGDKTRVETFTFFTNTSLSDCVRILLMFSIVTESTRVPERAE